LKNGPKPTPDVKNRNKTFLRGGALSLIYDIGLLCSRPFLRKKKIWRARAPKKVILKKIFFSLPKIDIFENLQFFINGLRAI